MAIAVSSVQYAHHYTYGFLTNCDDLAQILLRRGEFLLGTLYFLAQSRESRRDLIRRGGSVVEHGAQLFLGFFYRRLFSGWCAGPAAAGTSGATRAATSSAKTAASAETAASEHHAASGLPAEFLHIRNARSEDLPLRLGGAELLPKALVHPLAHLLRIELPPTALRAASLAALTLLAAASLSRLG